MWSSDVGTKEISMYHQIIASVETAMATYLSNEQLDILHDTLVQAMQELPNTTTTEEAVTDLVQIFLSAKRVEGCSDKTVIYYDSTIRNVLNAVGKDVRDITTDDLRVYLDRYQSANGVSKVTIDNIRRIHKVKTCKTVKETYSDEALELMRDHSECVRDLAIIDILASTGIRVGELVKLDRSDMDFVNRECIVLGKGNKQRKVYFDARTKIHLQRYLDSRNDDNPALFVTLQRPHNRLQISGVEIRLRRLGEKLNLNKVHPHKFRRTLATMAIDKGMPIEQVQQLLGHQSVDTTLQYAMVNQSNVKQSHRRYIG